MASLLISENVGLALAILIFLIMVVFGVVMAKANKRRVAELVVLADSMGMKFSKGGDDIAVSPLFDMPLFQKGYGQKTKNVFRAGDESRPAFLEFSFTSGVGKEMRGYHQTVVAFKNAGATLSGFTLGCERFLHGVAEKLGFRDIDFDDSDEFSKQYNPQGENENEIRRLFEGNLVQYFTRNPKWNVEGKGENLIVYRSREMPKPADLPEFVKDAIEVARQFDFV